MKRNFQLILKISKLLQTFFNGIALQTQIPLSKYSRCQFVEKKRGNNILQFNLSSIKDIKVLKLLFSLYFIGERVESKVAAEYF